MLKHEINFTRKNVVYFQGQVLIIDSLRTCHFTLITTFDVSVIFIIDNW